MRPYQYTLQLSVSPYQQQPAKRQELWISEGAKPEDISNTIADFFSLHCPEDKKAVDLIHYYPFQKVSLQSKKALYSIAIEIDPYKIDPTHKAPQISLLKNHPIHFFSTSEIETPRSDSFIQIEEKIVGRQRFSTTMRFVSRLDPTQPPTSADLISKALFDSKSFSHIFASGSGTFIKAKRFSSM